MLDLRRSIPDLLEMFPEARFVHIVRNPYPVYQSMRNMYRKVHAAADAWLDETLESADGPLPPPSASFMQRFGGLTPAATSDKEYVING